MQSWPANLPGKPGLEVFALPIDEFEERYTTVYAEDMAKYKVRLYLMRSHDEIVAVVLVLLHSPLSSHLHTLCHQQWTLQCEYENRKMLDLIINCKDASLLMTFVGRKLRITVNAEGMYEAEEEGRPVAFSYTASATTGEWMTPCSNGFL